MALCQGINATLHSRCAEPIYRFRRASQMRSGPGYGSTSLKGQVRDSVCLQMVYPKFGFRTHAHLMPGIKATRNTQAYRHCSLTIIGLALARPSTHCHFSSQDAFKRNTVHSPRPSVCLPSGRRDQPMVQAGRRRIASMDQQLQHLYGPQTRLLHPRLE